MLEEVVPMFAKARSSESFDPLVDLAGVWTTDFAERYLPIEGAPPAKYECVDGKLILSPYEAGPNVYAAVELRTILKPAAHAAGLRVYPTVNLRFDFQKWIQPDFAVVRSPVRGTWVEAADVVVAGEFVSPSSRSRDRIDKPALCAAAEIPYYMTGEVSLAEEQASVQLWRLTNAEYTLVAKASAGERFEVVDPFTMSFDPIELLDL